MIKVMTIFGTRPEAIKMAPLVLEMGKRKGDFDPITVVTGQHREMLKQVLDVFEITPDYDLNIMSTNQTLASITTKILDSLSPVLEKTTPDIILVHGDTSTTFAASLAAFFHKIPIGHVEAGLRTWDKYSPFPEEMNRQLTDVLADVYFAPTEDTKRNLVAENKDESKIVVTGNTAIDALKITVSKESRNVKHEKRNILLTMHRRENQGQNMRNVFNAVNRITKAYGDVEFTYPVHLSPVVQSLAKEYFTNNDKVKLVKPMDVVDFHAAIDNSYFVMSDSGGVQEEAPALDKPVLVLRDTTERPEGVEAGTLKLVGTNEEDVFEAMKQLLDNSGMYKSMANAVNPYGDGFASSRILDYIAQKMG